MLITKLWSSFMHLFKHTFVCNSSSTAFNLFPKRWVNWFQHPLSEVLRKPHLGVTLSANAFSHDQLLTGDRGRFVFFSGNGGPQGEKFGDTLLFAAFWVEDFVKWGWFKGGGNCPKYWKDWCNRSMIVIADLFCLQKVEKTFDLIVLFSWANCIWRFWLICICHTDSLKYSHYYYIQVPFPKRTATSPGFVTPKLTRLMATCYLTNTSPRRRCCRIPVWKRSSYQVSSVKMCETLREYRFRLSIYFLSKAPILLFDLSVLEKHLEDWKKTFPKNWRRWVYQR